MFPHRDMPATGTLDLSISMLIDESLAMLPRLGLEAKWSGLRNVKTLRKRTSLVILRWHDYPTLSHALVFDGEKSVFVDPLYDTPLNHTTLNRNLFGIYYVKRIPVGQGDTLKEVPCQLKLSLDARP